MKEIPLHIFDFHIFTYEVVSENYYDIYFRPKTRYYIRQTAYPYDYMPHLCRIKTLGSKHDYLFCSSGIFYKTIYWDTQEEAIDVIERAMRGEVGPRKREENVVYSTSND